MNTTRSDRPHDPQVSPHARQQRIRAAERQVTNFRPWCPRCDRLCDDGAVICPACYLRLVL